MTNLIIILLMLSSQSEIQSITFGNGGGFTGAVHTYVLTNKGNLYSKNAFTEEKTLIKRVDSSSVAKIFQKVQDSKMLNIDLNKPGNTYKFISFKVKGKQHKLVWSGKSENKSLNLLYKELMSLNATNE